MFSYDEILSGIILVLHIDNCIDNSVKLVNGNSNSSAGRVEVCRYGIWGRVCADDLIGLTEGDVVCKELGFIGGT